MASRLARGTATGLVVSGPLYLRSVIVNADAAASNVLLQDTAAGGGTDLLKVSANANDSQDWVSGDRQGVFFEKGIYATLTGAGASFSIEYEPAP